MPKHDIIDNRTEKLVDHINRIFSLHGIGSICGGLFFSVWAGKHRATTGRT